MIPRDVIFPAWMSPYMSTVCLFPVALGAFGIEAKIHSKREALPWNVAIVWAMAANAVSSVAGIALGLILEEGGWSWFSRSLGYFAYPSGPYLAWCLAFALSVLIEFPFLRTRREGPSWAHRIGTVLLANLASYALLGGITLAFELL